MSSPPRLTGIESLILELLIDKPDQYGLELVAGSHRRLKRGTVYVTLGRMEEKGLVESAPEPPPEGAGPSRRIYRPTALGIRVFQAWQLMRQMFSPETAR